VLKAARLPHHPERLVDIGVRDGRIAAIAPSLPHASEIEPINGGLVVPGFVETHIHLDKSCSIDRCSCNEGSLREAIAETARAKRAFTEADITARAARSTARSRMAPCTGAATSRSTRGWACRAFGPCANSRAATPGPTAAAAKLRNFADYGLAVGNAADLLVLPCRSPAAAVSELCAPSPEFKRGRKSFSRPAAHLNRPSPSAPAGAGDTRATTQ
jgi:cytosine/adenosine deaminase-related metal-dependent hydrolase